MLPAALGDLLLGLVLAPGDAANRCSVEGLTWVPKADGSIELGIRKLEATALRVASGPLTLEVGHVALHQVAGLLRIEAGGASLGSLQAAGAEVSGLKVEGPLMAARAGTAAPAGSWLLAPLATAEGTIRAKILDAHLMFDADVTVRIRQGRVDFNEATVEHVGPDSHMGVSRLGFHVDAPNGRSYLYQFSSAPVAGVEYERRGLGPWVSDRGNVQLQPFGEWFLRQLWGGQAQGITEQARLLLDRTSVSGDVQLGGGKLAGPGVQAEMAGRAEGRNVARVHSEAVGRGVGVEMAALSVREVVLAAGGSQLHLGEIAGALMLRLFTEGKQLRFAFTLANAKLSALRLGV